jgi:hypothetical protein
VTLFGGPEDGREVDVPVGTFAELPPVLRIADAPRPTLWQQVVDDEPVAAAYAVHEYRRERLEGPPTRWRYVYASTS